MRSPQSQTRVVLVADDDKFIRDHVGALLGASGVTVEYASNGAEAIRSLSDRLDTLVVDLDMPGATGLEVLAVASRKFPRLPVIMLSGAGQVEDAVAALKRGAFDYIRKPFDEEELIARVREALRVNKLETENRQLRAYQSEATEGVRLVMTSPSSIALKERAACCAGVDSTVLITGPSGTGKSVLARWIHQQGPRSAGPFVAVNCGALPRELIESELFGHEKGAFTGATASKLGRFEAAAGGTLFLDEIGELPLDLQPKLLHAIQDRVITRLGSVQAVPVDVRLIAATNRDLEQAITERLFREDLYYRLNVLSLEIASLRARREDILPIAAHTLERIAQRLGVLAAGLTEKASEAMLQHDWPGNVRELENILERAMVFSGDRTIDLPDLGPLVSRKSQISDDAFVGTPLAEIERRAILATLATHGGNRNEAAISLGISERTIYNRLKEYGRNVDAPVPTDAP